MEPPNEIAMLVLPKGYTRRMAKVMVSFPDELLVEIDREAERQGTTRSGLLQRSARREIGLGTVTRGEILKQLDELSEKWSGPTDTVSLVRRERMRNG